MIEVFQEITSLYNSGMGHTLYYGEARQGANRPYGVLTVPSPVQSEDTFTAKIHDLTAQINMYYDELQQAFAGLEQCKGLFDDTTIEPDGFWPVTLRKEFETPPVKLDKGWMVVIEYNCKTQKK